MIRLDVSSILGNRGLNFRCPDRFKSWKQAWLPFLNAEPCWDPGCTGRRRRVLRRPPMDLLPVFSSLSASISPVIITFLSQSNLLFNAFSELLTSTILSLFLMVSWFGKRFPSTNFLLSEVRPPFAFNPGQLER